MTEDRLPLAELLAKAGDGDFLRSVAEAVVQLLMETDVEGLIGAGRHERSGERTTYRNGYRDRTLDTRLGSLQLCIPKLRQGSYLLPALPRAPQDLGEGAGRCNPSIAGGDRSIAERTMARRPSRGSPGQRRLDEARRRPGAGDGAGWDQREHRQQAVQEHRRPRRGLPRSPALRRLTLSLA